ncbi:PorV/PorQ family protein [bacterium]|nr:PorV/PorQ family protein [bacterium]
MKATPLFALMGCLTMGLSVRAQLLPVYGGERAGQSALSFLKNDLNPRSLAMSGASMAGSGDAYAWLTNPALATQCTTQNWSLSHAFLGGGVDQSAFTGIFPLSDRVSSLGFALNTLQSGAIEERTEFQPEGTGRTVYASYVAAGVGYARKLSAQFSIGVQVKYLYEGLADYHNHTAAADLGFLYQTDYKDLQFAVLVSHFGGSSSLSGTDLVSVFNRTPQDQLDANPLPTTFSLGVSALPWKIQGHSLRTSVQLNHPNDNAENYRLGLEYDYKNLLAVRSGIRLNVSGMPYPSFGAGLRSRIGGHSLFIDYAANPTDLLGFQHALGLRFTLMSTDR